MLLGRKESNYWLLTQLVSKTGEKRKVVQLYCTAVWPFHYFLHFYSHQLAMLLSLLLRHEHTCVTPERCRLRSTSHPLILSKEALGGSFFQMT